MLAALRTSLLYLESFHRKPWSPRGAVGGKPKGLSPVSSSPLLSISSTNIRLCVRRTLSLTFSEPPPSTLDLALTASLNKH